MSTAAQQVERGVLPFLSAIWREGEVRELRIPKADGWHTRCGWFDSPEKLAQAAQTFDGRVNIYVTLNPVDPALLARACNRMVRAESATADADILARRWLFLDIDSVRPSGISATEEELAHARALLADVTSHLAERGWPDPIVCLSGNGYYALYPIELPNAPEARTLLERVLKCLASRCDTPRAHIDPAVANASRIIGLVGTKKAKGEDMPDRPHRYSEILSLPDEIVPVSEEQLRALLDHLEPKKPRPRSGARPSRPGIPLRDMLDHAGLEYRVHPPDANGVTWYHLRRCPFHDDGRDYECGVGQTLPDGPYAGHCFHPEGQGKGWREFKEALGLGESTSSSDAHHQAMVEAPVGPDAAPPAPHAFPRTDSGNAELFAHLNQEKVRYDHQRGHWLIWQGHRFAPEANGEIWRLAKQAARERYLRAADLSDGEERRREADWAIKTENKQRLEAMLGLARSEEPLADAGTDWDRQPWLLGVKNGVVDLTTGRLRAGRPHDAITLAAGTHFDAKAKAVRFHRFLSEIFEANPELISFVQRAVGYALTGLTSEQCFFLFFGRGSNGKSVLLNILLALMGDYGYAAPFSTFEYCRGTSIPNDVAQLAGRRLVVASETNEGARLDEARIKSLTGGEPQSARFLNHEFFTFTPQCAIFLAVNHRPQVADDSRGFWRRVRLVPFRRELRVDEIDPHLTEKLKAELPGILAWAVEGCLEWQRQGLNPPRDVAAATADYQADSDPLSDFLAECCMEDANLSVGASTVFRRYREWGEDHKLPERELLSSRIFGERLSARFNKERQRAGIVYFGLGVRS